ncbi:MAG: RICIN domain-containing protein [Ruminococcus sp.]
MKRFKAKTNNEKAHSRTPRHYKTMRIGLVLATMMFGGVFYGLAVSRTPETEAIEPADFNAGYLIDDSVFYNPNAMTVEEIQSFLDEKSPACDMWGTGLISGRKYPDGTWVPSGTTRAEYAKTMRETYGNTKYHNPPYVCINKFYENPETHETLYETQGVATAGMVSAAQIIYDVAQEYNVNPQVLLVLIKKESLVWGDNWPLKYEYNTVTGYGCPDGAPCNEAYYGFYNQVQKAAWQFNYYREHPNAYRYKPNQINNIQYHPNTSCGTKEVYLENIATTSLYIYTPYTPNDAALLAYPGAGDNCSSYGNRNFYMFFREWFGSTYSEKVDVDANVYDLASGKYRIVPVSNLDASLQVINSSLIVSQRQNSDVDTYSIIRQDDGSYILTNDQANMSLDVENNERNPGTSVLIWRNHGETNQRWKIYRNSNGTYSFATMLSLDMSIINVGGSLQIDYYSKNNSDMQFYLVPVWASVVDETTTYRLQSVANNSLYFDIYNNISPNDTYGLLSTYRKKDGESNNQTFKFLLDKTGYYRIINTVSNLNITTSDTDFNNLNPITVTQYKNSCGQLWDIKKLDDGSLIFISACSEKVIDLNMDNGSIILFTNHDGENQKWRLEAVSKRPLEEGVYIISSALSSNYKLVSTGNLKGISLVETNSPTRFTLKYDDYDGSYQFIDEGGLAVDLANNSMIRGSNIISFQNHGKNNQKWILTSSGSDYYTISSLLSSNNIDIWNEDLNKGKIIQWTPHERNNQLWHFDRVSD